MTVNEVKYQAKLAEWKEHILECRSRGLSVAEWCAQNGYHRTTYYKWEREIFGQITAGRRRHAKEVEYVVPDMVSNTPEIAELPIAAPPSLAFPEIAQPMKFAPVAVIRIGKVELELSNAVSGDLMRQLKGLMGLAE